MELLARGLHVPEGPALLPDGRIVFTEQTRGCISVLAPGGVEVLAFTGGSPNSCAVAADGSLYVCQNGGIVGAWRSPYPRTPSIQRVESNGAVTTVVLTVAGRRLVAPNDLAFRVDDTLCFTDPAQPFDPANRLPVGAIYALQAPPRVLADTPGTYCNGIGVDLLGRVVWVESYTRRVYRLESYGAVTLLCELPDGHTPDGFAIAKDGRIFIATCGSHGISVISPEGELLNHLLIDDEANPTNCCFVGSDLVVTDFGMEFVENPTAGRLWQLPTDTSGTPVYAGSVLAGALA